MSTKFDIKEFVETNSSGQIEVILKDFEVNEEGRKTTLKAEKAPENRSFKVVLFLDKETFKYANSSVAKALIDRLKVNQNISKKADKYVGDFVNRIGKFKNIKEKENRDVIKNGIKKLKGNELEALAFAVETMLKDKNGNFSDKVYSLCINYDFS